MENEKEGTKNKQQMTVIGNIVVVAVVVVLYFFMDMLFQYKSILEAVKDFLYEMQYTLVVFLFFVFIVVGIVVSLVFSAKEKYIMNHWDESKKLKFDTYQNTVTMMNILLNTGSFMMMSIVGYDSINRELDLLETLALFFSLALFWVGIGYSIIYGKWWGRKYQKWILEYRKTKDEKVQDEILNNEYFKMAAAGDMCFKLLLTAIQVMVALLFFMSIYIPGFVSAVIVLGFLELIIQAYYLALITPI